MGYSFSKARILNQFGVMFLGFSFVYATCSFAGESTPQDLSRHFNVRSFGAVGDGKTDDTTAFQKALDAAGKAGGGVVYAPRGNYFFTGNLTMTGLLF
jgi:hypothetical protein